MKLSPVLIAWLYMLTACSPEKEKHVIKEGFTGWVLILFDAPDGQELPRENGFRVYNIPENGKLKLKEGSNDGKFGKDALEFYRLDKDGRRHAIPFFPGWISEERFKNEVAKLDGNEIIVQAPGMLGGDANGKGGGMSYFVGPVKDSALAEESFMSFMIEATKQTGRGPQ